MAKYGNIGIQEESKYVVACVRLQLETIHTEIKITSIKTTWLTFQFNILFCLLTVCWPSSKCDITTFE